MAKVAQATIRKAVIKARYDWVDYTDFQEIRIWNLFNGAADRITEQIMRFEKAGIIPPTQLIELRRVIKLEINSMRPRLGGIVRTGMRNSVDHGLKTSIREFQAQLPDLAPNTKIQIGTSFFGADGQIRRYDASVEAFSASQWAQINGDTMDFLIRYRPEGLTLSERVWNVTFDVQRKILTEVDTAVLLGESPAELSRTIRKHLVEPKRLFRRVRLPNGKLGPSTAFKAFKPGKGVFKSSYRNALRLARTEMSRAYLEGSLRYAHRKTWIDGKIWRVGNITPCAICDDLDGQFFLLDDVPAIPHPSCYCYTENHHTSEPPTPNQHELLQSTQDAIWLQHPPEAKKAL